MSSITPGRWWPRGRLRPPLHAGVLAVCALLLTVAPGPLWQGDSPAAPAVQGATHPAGRAGHDHHARLGHEMAALRRRLARVGHHRTTGHLMPAQPSGAKPAPIREHSLATWPRRAPGARDAR
jgi:hypothetical protein